MALSLKQKIFPYLVVATGCALCLGPITLSFSCAGIFYTPVSETLGISTGTFALYMTFFYLTQTIVLPLFGGLLERHDVRIVLSVAVLLMGVPLIAMSRFTAVWQFYLAGAFMGVGNAPIMYLAVPTLLTRWFEKRVGFYVGLCMACTGVGGVIFNAIGGMIIAGGAEGWRTCYLVFGVLMLVIALPFTLFGVRSRPSEIGIDPVGSAEWRIQSIDLDEVARNASENVMQLDAANDGEGVNEEGVNEEAKATTNKVEKAADSNASGRALATKKLELHRGVTVKEALRMPSFYAMSVFAFTITSLLMFYLFFPSYASSLGAEYPQVAAMAAGLASAVMAGQAAGKVLLGSLGDKSVLVGLVFMLACGAVGLLLLWLIPSIVPLLLLAGVLFGVLYAGETVQMPLMARTIFGSAEYSRIYSRVTMLSSLGGTIFASIWGFVAEGAGYEAAFVLALCMLAVLAASGIFALLRK